MMIWRLKIWTVLLILSIGIAYSKNSEKEKINHLFEQSELLKRKSNFSGLSPIADSIISISRKINDNQSFVRGLSLKAESITNRHDKNIYDALFYNYYVLNLSKSKRFYNATAIFNVYLNLANIYVEFKKNNIAYYYLSKSLEIAESIDDYGSLALVYTQAGNIDFEKERFVEARDFYFKSKECIEKINKTIEIGFLEQQVLSNIGLCFQELGLHDIAIAYFDSALFKINKMNPELEEAKRFPMMAKGVVLGNKGYSNLKLGKEKEGIDNLLQSIEINFQKGYSTDHAFGTYIKLASYYLKKENFCEVSKIIALLDKYYKTFAQKSRLSQLEKLKSDYHLAIKNDSEAIVHLKKYVELQDSLKKQMAGEDLSFQIYSLKLDNLTREIIMVKEENEFRTKKETVYLFAAILLLVAISITAYLVIIFRRNFFRTKMINEKLNQLNTSLENKTNEQRKLIFEKDNILSIVAHDLRAPISNLEGLIELLKDTSMQYPDELKEENAKVFGYIDASFLHIKSIISDLVEVAQMERNDYSMELVSVNFNFLLEKLFEIYKPSIDKKYITIIIDNKAKKNDIVASPEKISRVLANLLSNAIKFSHKGDKIIIKIWDDENYFNVSIIDNGIGIEPHNIDLIFDRFTKAKRKGTEGENPVGLGLSIVKQIIQKHKGQIKVESEVGRGSTFTFSIPLKKM